MADISSPDRVGVKVWPDTRGFLADLRKTLKKVEKQVRVNIPVAADAGKVAAQAKGAAKAAEKAAGKIEVPASLEDGFLAQMQRDLKAATKAVEADIPLTADGERMRRDVHSAVATIQAQMQAMAIEVPLDVEEAAAQKAELRGQIAMLQAMASADPVEIPVKVDVDHRALAETRKAMSSMSMPSMPAMPALTALPKATAIAAIGIAALGSLPAISALAVGIAQMSTALLALPAIGVGAIASVAAIAIGVSGLGEAFKTAGEGGEKYAEAMANLAPAARTFVTSIRSLGDGFGALRLDVQQNLFRGLGAEIKALGTAYLPTLTSGLSGTADAINSVVREWSVMARSGAAVADTGSMFDNVNAAIERASGGVTAFSAGLRRLAEIGSGVLPDLSDGFTRLGEKFDEWTAKGQQSGAIEESMRRGGQAALEVASILGSLGSIIGGVFTAMSNAIGGSPLAALASGLERVAGIVQGPAFQTGLTTFFEGMRDGWGAIKAGLGDLGAALGDIAPGLADLSRAFGAGLGTVLSTVADLIASNKDTINSFFQSFADASPLVQGLVVGFMLLAPVIMSAITAVSGIVGALAAVGSTGAIIAGVVAGAVALGGALVALYQNSAPVREAFGQIGQLIQTLGAAIMPILQQAFTALGPPLMQIGAAVVELVGALAGRLMPVITFLAPFIQQVFTNILGIVGPILSFIAALIRTVAAVIRGDWSAAWTGIKDMFAAVWQLIKNIVVNALNTIKLALSAAWPAIKAAAAVAWSGFKALIAAAWAGIKAIVVAAIAVVRGSIAAGWAGIRAVTSAVWNGIKAVLSGTWNTIKALVSAGVAFVRGRLSAAWNFARSATSAAWNFIRSSITNAINGARAVVSSVVGAIRGAISSAWNSVRSATSSAWNSVKSLVSSAWNAIRSSVSDGISRVVSLARSLPGKAKSALGNLGNTLKSAGRELIQGLISGITEKIGALRDKMGDVASTVKKYMPGSPVQEGPLTSWNYGGGVSGAGRRLIGGLAEGMEAELRAVAAASSRVASAANVPTDGIAASYASRPSAGADLERAISGWQPIVHLGDRDFYGAMKRVTNKREGR